MDNKRFSPLIFLLILILGAAPPLLVFLDRWQGVLSPDTARDLWCRSAFLCNTQLPAYFFIVMICSLALPVLMFFQRQEPRVVLEKPIHPINNGAVSPRQAQIGLMCIIAAAWGLALVILTSLINQHYPGWELVLAWMAYLAGWLLQSIPIKSLINFWKEHGEFWLAILLAHLALVTTLASYFGQRQFFGATLALLTIALVNLWRFRQRIPLILGIISLALVMYSIDINAWWMAVAGDEYYFHDFAWRLAEKTSFLDLGEVLFKTNGVFAAHPYLSSLLQAIPMMFLGHENFGWRFSTLYLSALGIGFFYLFARTFLDRRVALSAAFLLAVSHYIMTFGKIGYNNLQALFVLNLALAASAWVLRAKHYLSFACLGSILGLCLYLYPAALYVIPLPFLLLAAYYPPISRPALKGWLVMLIPAVALAYPLFFQPIYWQNKLEGTLFHRADLIQSWAATLEHVATNLLYSVFSFLYIPIPTHFVSSSYVDPLTGGLILIGIAVFLSQARGQRFAVFVAVSFVLFLFFVGASHDRPTPPITRMFLLLPWYALFAAWGLDWILNHFNRIRIIPTVLLLIAVIGLNLYQAYQLSYIYYSPVTQIGNHFLRISQNLYQVEPQIPKNYVFVAVEPWDMEGLLRFQAIYPHLAWAQLYQIQVNEPALPVSSLPLLAERNTVVFLLRELGPAWQAALGPSLQALGKKTCTISTLQGQIVLYHAPDLPQACPPVRP